MRTAELRPWHSQAVTGESPSPGAQRVPLTPTQLSELAHCPPSSLPTQRGMRNGERVGPGRNAPTSPGHPSLSRLPAQCPPQLGLRCRPPGPPAPEPTCPLHLFFAGPFGKQAPGIRPDENTGRPPTSKTRRSRGGREPSGCSVHWGRPGGLRGGLGFQELCVALAGGHRDVWQRPSRGVCVVGP